MSESPVNFRPLSLGIETLGGVMTKLIDAYPTGEPSTAESNQMKRGTPPSPPRRARSSAPPPTTSPRWKSTCCRASAPWPTTTRPSAASTSPASRQHRVECPRLRSPCLHFGRQPQHDMTPSSCLLRRPATLWSKRQCPRQGHRQEPEYPHRGLQWPQRRRDQVHEGRSRGPRRRRQEGQGGD